MGRGIVAYAAGTRLPSEHYEGHFPGTSPQLGDFTAGLIDGAAVTLSDPLDVIPHQANGGFAQFAVVDTSAAGERAFVLSLLARTDPDLLTTPDQQDSRGTPVLLKDIHDGPAWDAYNCSIVDFQVWPRERLYSGKWPKV